MDEPLDYLSPAWVEAFARAVEDASELAEVATDAALVVQQTVVGTPYGDVTYALEAYRGRLRVVPGPVPAPDVTMVEDYETACRISRGDLTAREAFISGRIRLGGDPVLLIEHAGLLAGLDGVFASLRARTRYPSHRGPSHRDPG